jgi:hypothetical protein
VRWGELEAARPFFQVAEEHLALFAPAHRLASTWRPWWRPSGCRSPSPSEAVYASGKALDRVGAIKRLDPTLPA